MVFQVMIFILTCYSGVTSILGIFFQIFGKLSILNCVLWIVPLNWDSSRVHENNFQVLTNLIHSDLSMNSKINCFFINYFPWIIIRLISSEWTLFNNVSASGRPCQYHPNVSLFTLDNNQFWIEKHYHHQVFSRMRIPILYYLATKMDILFITKQLVSDWKNNNV